MRIKFGVVFLINMMIMGILSLPANALEHSQQNGLFSMDIPASWHWFEYKREIIITYPDGKTMAIDIQLLPSRGLSQDQIKSTLKEANDKMIKDGIEAHNGTLIDNKEISVDGVYATRLDFRTSFPYPVTVTYVSFFNKGYAFTVTYGSADEGVRGVMDDALATFKFGKS